MDVQINGRTMQLVAVADPATGAPSAAQAVSAASLPLPAGASTAALQTTLNGEIGALTVGAVTDPGAASASTNALLRGILTALNAHTALLQTIANNTTPAL